MSVIPSMVQNRKHLAVFKNAGAVGKDNAKTLDELGLKENIVIKRLLKLNSLAVDNNKYYITDAFAQTIRFTNI